MTFTGYAGETIPLQRYDRIEATKLELHYINCAKNPKNAVVQVKHNSYGTSSKNDRTSRRIELILEHLKTPKTKAQVAEDMGLGHSIVDRLFRDSNLRGHLKMMRQGPQKPPIYQTIPDSQ